VEYLAYHHLKWKDPMENNYNPYFLASRWSRCLAALIDMLLIGGCWGVVYLIVLLTGSSTLLNELSNIIPPILISLMGVLFYVAINWAPLGASAQTIGKMIMKIQVENMDGSRPSRTDILLKRSLPYFAFPLIPVIGLFLSTINLMFIFGTGKRCIHDYIANTQVTNCS
jgi:uncharacterized RDD family membrane protein YckC